MRSAARPSASPERRALSGVDDSAPATSSYWSSMREAMRWTAPMKAPSPPPTMPSLILPPVLGVAASLDGHVLSSPHFSPSARLICFLSTAPPAKSSNAFSVTRMM